MSKTTNPKILQHPHNKLAFSRTPPRPSLFAAQPDALRPPSASSATWHGHALHGHWPLRFCWNDNWWGAARINICRRCPSAISSAPWGRPHLVCSSFCSFFFLFLFVFSFFVFPPEPFDISKWWSTSEWVTYFSLRFVLFLPSFGSRYRDQTACVRSSCTHLKNLKYLHIASPVSFFLQVLKPVDTVSRFR